MRHRTSRASRIDLRRGKCIRRHGSYCTGNGTSASVRLDNDRNNGSGVSTRARDGEEVSSCTTNAVYQELLLARTTSRTDFEQRKNNKKAKTPERTVPSEAFGPLRRHLGGTKSLISEARVLSKCHDITVVLSIHPLRPPPRPLPLSTSTHFVLECNAASAEHGLHSDRFSPASMARLRWSNSQPITRLPRWFQEATC